MKPLTWHEYYENFDSWAEKTRESYVSRLVSVGEHDEVAQIVNAIYNQSVASRLANMAMDAGVSFDSEDIFLMEYSVNEETLKRMQDTKDDRALRKRQKKENREAFWTGVGEVMIMDEVVKTLFGKKK